MQIETSKATELIKTGATTAISIIPQERVKWNLLGIQE